MAEEKRMEQYLRQVEEQIRWKRARTAVTRELRQHLEDQREACLAAGLSPEEAEAEAVRQMGDPVSVGQELNRLHRPRPQWGLMALTLALAAVGMGLSLMTADSLAEAVQYRLPGLLAGSALCVLIYFWDCKPLLRHPMVSACLFALAPAGAQLLCDQRINYFWYGSWLGLIFLPVSLALLVYSMRGKGYRGLLGCGLGYLVLAEICLAVPSVNDLAVLTLTGGLLLLMAIRSDLLGVERKGLCTLLVIAALLTLAGINLLLAQHRIDVLLRPEQYAEGEGYLALAIRRVLGASQWLGAGGGDFTEHEPELIRDLGYTFTWLAYDYGRAVALAVLLLMAAFLAVGLRTCFRQRTGFGRLLSTAVLLPMTLQTLMLCMNCAGITVGRSYLPLLTESNALTALELALIGLLLSLFRQRDLLRDAQPQPREPRVKKTYTFTISI